MGKLYQIKRMPTRAWKALLYRISPLMSDIFYVKCLFRVRLGYPLNLKRPKTFNEKMQWLKIYGHKPIYTIMADKYKVKKYVTDIIGEKYIVPCLGVWDDANDIDFEKLPDKFVLKCNFNSGQGMCICKDKSKIDIDKIRKDLNREMKRGYYYHGRDKQYRDIEKKIIADTFLDDHRPGELQDYKFWCFNGEPTYMYITNKNPESVFENYYDMDFNPVDIYHNSPRAIPEYSRPQEFEEMKRLARILSKGLPFVRIDFFDVDHHIYFGEFTFFDFGGFIPFRNYEMDLKLGELIQLPVD